MRSNQRKVTVLVSSKAINSMDFELKTFKMIQTTSIFIGDSNSQPALFGVYSSLKAICTLPKRALEKSICDVKVSLNIILRFCLKDRWNESGLGLEDPAL